MVRLEETVRHIIVECLELPAEVQTIKVSTPLFGSKWNGGLGLDSLSKLEILAELAARFDHPMGIVSSDFQSISTLADYLRRKGLMERA